MKLCSMRLCGHFHFGLEQGVNVVPENASLRVSDAPCNYILSLPRIHSALTQLLAETGVEYFTCVGTSRYSAGERNIQV